MSRSSGGGQTLKTNRVGMEILVWITKTNGRQVLIRVICVEKKKKNNNNKKEKKAQSLGEIFDGQAQTKQMGPNREM